MTKYQNIAETIGNTPLVKINKLTKNSNLYAKVEFFNPAGSVKDRVALAMIEAAEKNGFVKQGTTVIEPTSGNTGIGLALICAIKGYKLILTMPETMSVERRKLLKAYGAELVLTDGAKGMNGAIIKAEELHKQIENSFIPQQFKNPANPQKHYETTAREIWNDLDGKIDAFVAGVGTGGTISGVGRYLKEQNSNVQIIAVEPKDSPVLSGGQAGPHKIQGIGAGFVPATFDRNYVDEIVTVSTEDAVITARTAPKEEGLLIGISSGASLFVAIKYADANPDKTVVVLLPDTGERYLSSGLFD
ncbi:cysteine synthase A [bacterium]|nr:cysteine synthase A [bacterium]